MHSCDGLSSSRAAPQLFRSSIGQKPHHGDKDVAAVGGLGSHEDETNRDHIEGHTCEAIRSFPIEVARREAGREGASDSQNSRCSLAQRIGAETRSAACKRCVHRPVLLLPRREPGGTRPIKVWVQKLAELLAQKDSIPSSADDARYTSRPMPAHPPQKSMPRTRSTALAY